MLSGTLAGRGRFPPTWALSGDAYPGRVLVPSPKNRSQDEQASVGSAPQRPAEEMTEVKRIQIQRPKVPRERPWREVLPSDPRDPDVVRVKALACAQSQLASGRP